MTKPNDLAFPAQPLGTDGLPVNEMSNGLTKREYFAAMAMQGIKASTPGAAGESVAVFAVREADALIARLNNETK